MKPILTLSWCVSLLLSFQAAIAQTPPYWGGNYYKDQAGGGLFVNSPLPLAKQLTYTFAANANPPWGGVLASPMINVPVVKTSDSFACSSQSGLTGKIALLYRGNCEFGVKALNAQNAGAAGVIIINNVPGLLDMGAGAVGSMVTIPVIMIQKTDGDALHAALTASQAVTVSFTPWATGFTNDLAIVKGALPQWHAKVMPRSMMLQAVPYFGVGGGYMANYGSATATNVKLKMSLNFTPTGGSPGPSLLDSAVISSFAPSDSMKFSIFENLYYLTPATTGKYTATYNLSAAQTDNNPANNTQSTFFDVSDSVLSKGRYDLANVKPLSDFGFKFNNTATLSGPMYYVGVGNHVVKRAQFIASNNTPGIPLSNNSPVTIYLLKWTDGVVSMDGVIQPGELSVKGEGTKNFSSADTNFMTYSVELKDATYPDRYPILDSNSWYWLAAEADDLFIGVDGDPDNNFFLRSFAFFNHAQGTSREHYAATFQGELSDLLSNFIDPWMYPYENAININNISFTNQKRNLTPAIAMHVKPAIMSAATTATACIGANNGSITVTPATGVGPYEYKLGNGAFQASNVFNNVGGGKYVITIRDANSSFGYLDVKVDSVSVPVAEAGAQATIIEGGNAPIGGAPTATGNGPFTYTWTPATGLDNATIANPQASPLTTTTYTVNVTDNNGCNSKDSVLVVVWPLDINDAAGNASIQVYPNPASGLLNVTAKGVEDGLYSLELTDVSGKLLNTISFDMKGGLVKQQLDISAYPAGYYMLKITNGRQSASIKIQKKATE